MKRNPGNGLPPPANDPKPAAVGHSVFVDVRVAAYNARSGAGAVVREDTGERLDFYGFHSDLCNNTLTPGERVWGEIDFYGDVVNLIRLN